MPKNYQELLDIEKRFEHYLQSKGLKKEGLASNQFAELREAFMSGLSSTIVLLNQDLDGLNDMEGLNCMAHLLVQVYAYWKTMPVNPYPSLSLDY